MLMVKFFSITKGGDVTVTKKGNHIIVQLLKKRTLLLVWQSVTIPSEVTQNTRIPARPIASSKKIVMENRKLGFSSMAGDELPPCLCNIYPACAHVQSGVKNCFVRLSDCLRNFFKLIINALQHFKNNM